MAEDPQHLRGSVGDTREPTREPDEPTRVALGKLAVHAVTFDDAVARIVRRAQHKQGGYIFTPNVDHVVLVESDVVLRDAYAGASLVLVDGKPLVWLASLTGHPVPQKISGSDLARPLAERAAKLGLSIFLLGGVEGVGQEAADLLVRDYPGLRIAGVCSPPFGFEKDPAEDARIVDVVKQAAPDFLFACLGSPKQELWLAKHHKAFHPTVCIGLGATLDFLTGRARRAPKLVSEAGLEWLFRLAHEPRRLAGRYLVRDRAFFGIALREIVRQRRGR